MTGKLFDHAAPFYGKVQTMPGIDASEAGIPSGQNVDWWLVEIDGATVEYEMPKVGNYAKLVFEGENGGGSMWDTVTEVNDDQFTGERANGLSAQLCTQRAPLPSTGVISTR